MQRKTAEIRARGGYNAGLQEVRTLKRKREDNENGNDVED